MVCTIIKAKSCHSSTANSVIRNHTVDSKLNSLFWLSSHECIIASSLHVADIACVAIIILLLKLVACENNLIAVDNDNMVTTVYMWCISCLKLTAKKVSSLNSNASE